MPIGAMDESAFLWLLLAIAAFVLLLVSALGLQARRQWNRQNRIRRWADENHYAILRMDATGGLWGILGICAVFTGSLGRGGYCVQVQDEEGGQLTFEITFRGRRMEFRRE
jgi:hypothetical protein